MKTKISIIIPIYNTGKFLAQCLDSVIKQSYQDTEIILIDDGSTDNSNKIAKKYLKQDSRIKLFTQKNKGPSAARNLGIQKATGDYLSFIDSDDEIEPDFLEKLFNALSSQTSLSLCGMNYRRIKLGTSKNVYLSPPMAKHKHQSKASHILSLLAKDGRLYPVTNKLFRTDVIKKHDISFDESISFAEDTEFVLSYLKYASGDISCVLEPLYIYNYGSDNSTVQKTGIIWGNWQQSYNFLKNWVGDHPDPEERFWLFLIHCRWYISYRRSLKRAKA